MPTVSISARGKPAIPLPSFLQGFDTQGLSIDSVFGFTDPCELYGGRVYMGAELTPADLAWLEGQNIGYRIPLQCRRATEKMYKNSTEFLSKFNKSGNSVVIADHRLASRIREDFPIYSIECSVIVNINSMYKLEDAIALYDSVVVDPYWFNENNMADQIPLEWRSRVRLFINAGCMYSCGSRICYSHASKLNSNQNAEGPACSLGISPRLETNVPRINGMFGLDLQSYVDLGYSRFKLLRSAGTTGY